MAVVEPSALPRASDVAAVQDRCTDAWHRPKAAEGAEGIAALVVEQHRRNFDLWHEEDRARAPDASDAEIAAVKRAIDRLNQQRNDLVEKFDDAIAAELAGAGVSPPARAPWNTETPGAAVDRLSILSLKVYHMREQEARAGAGAEHVERCRSRRRTLEGQREDLVAALQTLLDDLATGRRQMKLYRQFKMYNDPALNPRIYGASAERGEPKGPGRPGPQ
jgi:hypothetical protein